MSEGSRVRLAPEASLASREPLGLRALQARLDRRARPDRRGRRALWDRRALREKRDPRAPQVRTGGR